MTAHTLGSTPHHSLRLAKFNLTDSGHDRQILAATALGHAFRIGVGI